MPLPTTVLEQNFVQANQNRYNTYVANGNNYLQRVDFNDRYKELEVNAQKAGVFRTGRYVWTGVIQGGEAILKMGSEVFIPGSGADVVNHGIAGVSQVSQTFINYKYDKADHEAKQRYETLRKEVSKLALNCFENEFQQANLNSMEAGDLLALQAFMLNPSLLQHLTQQDYAKWQANYQNVSNQTNLVLNQILQSGQVVISGQVHQLSEQELQHFNEINSLLTENFSMMYGRFDDIEKAVLEGDVRLAELQAAVNEALATLDEQGEVIGAITPEVAALLKKLGIEIKSPLAKVVISNNEIVDMVTFLYNQQVELAKNQEIQAQRAAVYRTCSLLASIGQQYNIPVLGKSAIVFSSTYTIYNSSKEIKKLYNNVLKKLTKETLSNGKLLLFLDPISAIGESVLTIISLFQHQESIEEVILRQLEQISAQLDQLKTQLKEMSEDIHRHLDDLIEQIRVMFSYNYFLGRKALEGIGDLQHNFNFILNLMQLNFQSHFVQELLTKINFNNAYLQKDTPVIMSERDFVESLALLKHWIIDGAKNPIVTGDNFAKALTLSSSPGKTRQNLTVVNNAFESILNVPSQISYLMSLINSYLENLLSAKMERINSDQELLLMPNYSYDCEDMDKLLVHYLGEAENIVLLPSANFEKEGVNSTIIDTLADCKQQHQGGDLALLAIYFPYPDNYWSLISTRMHEEVNTISYYDPHSVEGELAIPEELATILRKGNLFPNADFLTFSCNNWITNDVYENIDQSKNNYGALLVAAYVRLTAHQDVQDKLSNEAFTAIREEHRRALTKDAKEELSQAEEQLIFFQSHLSEYRDRTFNLGIWRLAVDNYTKMKFYYHFYEFDKNDRALMRTGYDAATFLSLFNFMQSNRYLLELLNDKISLNMYKLQESYQLATQHFESGILFKTLETALTETANATNKKKYLGNVQLRSVFYDKSITSISANHGHAHHADKFINIVDNYRGFTSTDDLLQLLIDKAVVPAPIYLLAQDLGLGYFEYVFYETVLATAYGLKITMADRYGVEIIFHAKNGKCYQLTEASVGQPATWQFVANDHAGHPHGNAFNLREVFSQQVVARTASRDNEANQNEFYRYVLESMNNVKILAAEDFLQRIKSENIYQSLIADINYLKIIMIMTGVPVSLFDKVAEIISIPDVVEEIEELMRNSHSHVMPVMLRIPNLQLVETSFKQLYQLVSDAAANSNVRKSIYTSPVISELNDGISIIQRYIFQTAWMLHNQQTESFLSIDFIQFLLQESTYKQLSPLQKNYAIKLCAQIPNEMELNHVYCFLDDEGHIHYSYQYQSQTGNQDLLKYQGILDDSIQMILEGTPFNDEMLFDEKLKEKLVLAIQHADQKVFINEYIQNLCKKIADLEEALQAPAVMNPPVVETAVNDQTYVELFTACRDDELVRAQELLAANPDLDVCIKHPYHSGTLLHAAFIKKTNSAQWLEFSPDLISWILNQYQAKGGLIEMLQTQLSPPNQERKQNWIGIYPDNVLNLDGNTHKTVIERGKYLENYYRGYVYPEMAGQTASPAYHQNLVLTQTAIAQITAANDTIAYGLGEYISALLLERAYPCQCQIDRVNKTLRITVDEGHENEQKIQTMIAELKTLFIATQNAATWVIKIRELLKLDEIITFQQSLAPVPVVIQPEVEDNNDGEPVEPHHESTEEEILRQRFDALPPHQSSITFSSPTISQSQVGFFQQPRPDNNHNLKKEQEATQTNRGRIYELSKSPFLVSLVLSFGLGAFTYFIIQKLGLLEEENNSYEQEDNSYVGSVVNYISSRFT